MKWTFLILLLSTSACRLNHLEGLVKESNGQAQIFVTVELYKDTTFIARTQTDFDGQYHFRNLDRGSYDLLFFMTGYVDQRLVDIKLKGGKTKILDNVELKEPSNHFEVDHSRLIEKLKNEKIDTLSITNIESLNQSKWSQAPFPDSVMFKTQVPETIYNRVHSNPQIVEESLSFYPRDVIYRRSILDYSIHQIELHGFKYFINGSAFISFNKIKNSQIRQYEKEKKTHKIDNEITVRGSHEANAVFEKYEGKAQEVEFFTFENDKVLYFDKHCFVSLFEEENNYQKRKEKEAFLCKQMEIMRKEKK